MFYVVPEEFFRIHGESLPGISGLKWRSKREVVGWLTKFAPQRDDSKSQRVGSQHNLGDEALQNGIDDCGPGLDESLKAHASDIVWSGVSWVCGKQLRYFQTFYLNGTTIPVSMIISIVLYVKFIEVRFQCETIIPCCAVSFFCSCLFLSWLRINRNLAYLDDMYEDNKGQKKVKVLWFHHNQEF